MIKHESKESCALDRSHASFSMSSGVARISASCLVKSSVFLNLGAGQNHTEPALDFVVANVLLVVEPGRRFLETSVFVNLYIDW